MGVELLFNSVEFGSQSSCQQTPRGLETRCGREGHTRPRGPRKPPEQLPADSQRVRDEMCQGRPHPTEGDLGNPQSSCQLTPRGLETRSGREGHTRPRGSSESPDGVDPNVRRTRHNVTVITVGSKYEVYVRSPSSSHTQTLQIK